MKQQQLQNWQRVRMPVFHALGAMIEMLEALERGEEVAAREKAPGPQGEPCSVTERYVCLKGACRLLLLAVQRSIEAVLARRVGVLEDVVIVECRLKSGEEVLDMLASAGGGPEARRN
jgi:hypothetical protein